MPGQPELFYESLLARYLDSQGTIDRGWLAAEVDSRLAKQDTRFVLLVGEPGAGKTGLMSALARKNPRWLRYFIRSDSTTPLSGADAVSLMLRVGLQLAHLRPQLFDPDALTIEVKQRAERATAGSKVTGVRIQDLTISPFYQTAIRVQQEVTTLEGGLVGIEIARATFEPRLLELDNLSHLALLDPALVLARQSPGETVVVLIDALDEVSSDSTATTIIDWLETAADLAPNLRFVLASRPTPRLETFMGVRGASLETIRIQSESDAVTKDVRAFAKKLFEETGALDRASGGIHDEVAVTALAKAALGNFAYLSAYARSLRSALASGSQEQVDELLLFENLPSGLDELSIAFARRMRKQIEKLGMLDVAAPLRPGDEVVPAWEGVGQRFLAVLVVSFAPLTLEQLIALGGARVWTSAAKNVLQCLVPFLDETRTGWVLFHPSVASALSGIATKSAPDIAVDAAEWHARIVRHYQGQSTWAQVDWEKMDSYGLLNVVRHLAATQVGTDALCAVITSGLRVALRKRFFSDLPFRRIVDSARGRVARVQSVANALSEGLFLELVYSGIAAYASKLAPAVFGLIARLGKVDEALARVQTLEPGLIRFRAMEAIWRSTPAPLRGALGPMDGIEMFIGAAIDIPRTASPMPGFPGMEFNDCMCDAALALIPHDFDRALRLMDLVAPLDHKNIVRDRFLKAAVPLVPSDRALQLLAKMSEDRSSAALEAAGKAKGHDRDQLIAMAKAHLDEDQESERGPNIARLLVLSPEDATDLRARLETWIASQSESSGSWGVVLTAEIVQAIDPEYAKRILRTCDQPEVDSLASSTLVAAAGLWATWGDHDESRRLLNKALEEFRSRGWYGPASDIVQAADVARGFDPSWAEELADEAVALVEDELDTADSFERSKLDSTLSQMVEGFRSWDRERALKIARWTGGSWIHGSSWDSTDGLTSALAVIALDAAEEKPELAERLLAECMAVEKSGVRLGRRSAKSADYGLFRALAAEEGENPTSRSRQANFFSYAANSTSYWKSGRKWRFFESPADILRSVDAPFPATASWARAVASAVVEIAGTDPDRALALAFWPVDAAERVVGLAGVIAALADDDPRTQVARSALVATQMEVPRYEPEIDLRRFPEAPVLFYLNPAYRAQFEAEMLLPNLEDPFRLLPNSRETAFLHQVLYFERLCGSLFDGTYAGIPADELDRQLDEVLASADDFEPLIKDFVNAAAAFALSASSAAKAKVRIEKIGHPSIWTAAVVRSVMASAGTGINRQDRALSTLREVPKEIFSLHRVQLAAIAIEECKAKDHQADISALFNWGMEQLEDEDPLFMARGLTTLSAFAPAAQQRQLLSRALSVSEAIDNPYVRSDAVADILARAVSLSAVPTVAKSLEALHDAGWSTFMNAISRAMPSIIAVAGVDILERMDAAMLNAQAVLESADSAEAPGHFDGVLSPELREAAVKAARDSADVSLDDYLALFLTSEDVPPDIRLAQDTRFQGPDAGDLSFAALNGKLTGLTAWQAGNDDTVGRIVDIRFLFATPSEAAQYHQERLRYNSEGRPAVPAAAAVGEECHVFGGTDTFELSGMSVQMTAFYYIYRVGRVVVKLFVAQGPGAREPLTPDRVRSMAERVVEKIGQSPFA